MWFISIYKRLIFFPGVMIHYWRKKTQKHSSRKQGKNKAGSTQSPIRHHQIQTNIFHAINGHFDSRNGTVSRNDPLNSTYMVPRNISSWKVTTWSQSIFFHQPKRTSLEPWGDHSIWCRTELSHESAQLEHDKYDRRGWRITVKIQPQTWTWAHSTIEHRRC